MTQEVTHGVSKHPYYKRWNDMVRRCYNRLDDRYPQCGALGISIDAEWDRRNPKGAYNYVVWVEQRVAEMPQEMRDKPFMVIRKDVTKNYGPGNCVIARNIEAAQSRTCAVLSFEKVVQLRKFKRQNDHITLAQMCELFGVTHVYTLSRCLQGISWSNVDSVEPPLTLVPRNRSMVALAVALNQAAQPI